MRGTWPAIAAALVVSAVPLPARADTGGLSLTAVSVQEGDSGQAQVAVGVFLPGAAALPTHVTLRVTSSSTGAGAVPGVSDVWIPAGATGSTFTMQVPGDRKAGSDQHIDLQADAAGGYVGSATTTFTVLDDDRTRRVNLSPTGEQADANSYPVTGMAAHGTLVSFASSASNLTPLTPQGPGNANGTADMFVANLLTGVTVKVDVTPTGGDPNGDVADGSLSASGAFAAFATTAQDLLPGRTAPYGSYNVYRRDLFGGATELVSAMPDGAFPDGSSVAPDISSDGRYVAYYSNAPLDPHRPLSSGGIYVTDMVTHRTSIASVYSDQPLFECWASDPDLTPDGSRLAFVCDHRLYIRNLITQRTHEVATRNSSGWLGVGDISLDARGDKVAFDAGTNGSGEHVYVKDLVAHTLTRVDRTPDGATPNGSSVLPHLNDDGSIVTYTSSSTDIVRNGPATGFDNVYAYDLLSHESSWLSVGNLGEDPDAGSAASWSSDGVTSSFGSCADNLVVADTNGFCDTFVRRVTLLPEVRIGDVAAQAVGTAERTVAVPVTLSQPLSRDVSVSWKLSSPDATAGTDYVGATSGTVTIPAGAVTAEVPVVLAAHVPSGSREVDVRLSKASAPATLTDRLGIVTFS